MLFLKHAVRRTRVTVVIACLLAAVASLPAGKAIAAEDTMKFVAAPASLTKAGAFIGFMKKNQITVETVAPADAAAFKKSNVVVIEGGMDDAATKALVTEVVGAAEAGPLAKDGAKKMFMKENMWQPGQKVLVFAGNNAESAAAARTENREAWFKYFKAWFELDESPEGLKGY
jgi:hypothetical protein